MSRCFPFPPQGYEKKTKTDDADLLNKNLPPDFQEKQKEKKHKRDKEKKEKKEKGDKDKSERKCKDKKHKKEKHKEKKKDKDKDRSSHSGKKNFPGHSQNQNGEKQSHDNKLPGKSEICIGEKPMQKDPEIGRSRISISGGKTHLGQFAGFNGLKVDQNIFDADDSRHSKFVQELGRRVRDEGGGAGSQFAENLVPDQKRQEGILKVKNSSRFVEGKEKNKTSNDRRLDGQGFLEENRTMGIALVENLSGTVAARIEGMSKEMDKDNKKRSGGKEKANKNKPDHGHQNKHKDGDKGKKSHVKGKDREKEKKKEKAKVESDHRNLELDNLKAHKKDDIRDPIDHEPLHPSEESNQNAVAEGNLQNWKDIQGNGFLHVNVAKPNKLPKPMSSCHIFSDNGTASETSDSSIPLSADRLGVATSHKVDNKERKLNGVVEAQLGSASSTKPSTSFAQTHQLNKMPVKPPHPDLKYLSHVLSVPKLDELPEFDDHDWLYGSNGSQTKKRKLESTGMDKTAQVWAEGLQIESADIYALPYVTPY